MNAIMCLAVLGIIGVATAINAEISVLRDPFMPKYSIKKPSIGPAGATSESPTGIALTGIVWDATTPTAILRMNGKTKSVEVGDLVFGVRVDRIDRGRVLLNRHGKTSILNLGASTNL